MLHWTIHYHIQYYLSLIPPDMYFLFCFSDFVLNYVYHVRLTQFICDVKFWSNLIEFNTKTHLVDDVMGGKKKQQIASDQQKTDEKNEKQIVSKTKWLLLNFYSKQGFPIPQWWSLFYCIHQALVHQASTCQCIAETKIWLLNRHLTYIHTVVY